MKRFVSKRVSVAVLAAALLVSPQFLFARGAGAQAPAAPAAREVPAILAGHSWIPAGASVAPPEGAPEWFRYSGRFAGQRAPGRAFERVTDLESVMGLSGGRPTGYSVPIYGQPLQGYSGIRAMPDGTFWALPDNGFGNMRNSQDALLSLQRVGIDWDTGAVEVLDILWFHDPDFNVPFHIINEHTERRYLTGSDFDPESFQITNDAIWVGDEFGPYLIKMDFTGRVQRVFSTYVDGRVVRSPEHHTVAPPGMPGSVFNFDVQRSKGFEGMALSTCGTRLFPLLEGALWTGTEFENVNGRRFLRLLEFCLVQEEWTGRYWQYVLEQNHLAIGDFNMISPTHALVIERDDFEGTMDFALPPGGDPERYFANPAQFKRVFLIEFSETNVFGPVTKHAYIDLLRIQDPNNVSRVPLNDGVFTFPHFTIESVDRVDEHHIIVANDTNFPFSSSRNPNRADDNEFILLRVEELLRGIPFVPAPFDVR